MSFSVATYTTLWMTPPIDRAERYSGWASTLLSTVRVRSSPKLLWLTLAGVRVVSVRFCPVRRASFLKVTTSVPEELAGALDDEADDPLELLALLVVLELELVLVLVLLELTLELVPLPVPELSVPPPDPPQAARHSRVPQSKIDAW